jgi:hypothetical protein
MRCKFKCQKLMAHRLRKAWENAMNRRDFLKGMAGVSLTWLAMPVLPAPPAATRINNGSALLYSHALNRTFRGTPDGLILESLDGGATWQAIANFGSHCSIERLFDVDDRVFVQVGVQDYSFLVASTDARTWRTTDRVL